MLDSRSGWATAFAAAGATAFTARTGRPRLRRSKGEPSGQRLRISRRVEAAQGWEGDRVCSGRGDHVYGEGAAGWGSAALDHHVAGPLVDQALERDQDFRPRLPSPPGERQVAVHHVG